MSLRQYRFVVRKLNASYNMFTWNYLFDILKWANQLTIRIKSSLLSHQLQSIKISAHISIHRSLECRVSRERLSWHSGLLKISFISILLQSIFFVLWNQHPTRNLAESNFPLLNGNLCGTWMVSDRCLKLLIK